MRSRLVLIDSFSEHDDARLKELLLTAYVPFTEEELTQLKDIPAVLISKEWFMDYDYALDNESGMKQTEFYNPQTLENNHFLHAWRVFSTSPFENGVVFGKVAPAVKSVSVSPAQSSATAGIPVQLTASVETEGFANKAVVWTVVKGKEGGVTVNQNGLVNIPVGYTPTGETPENAVKIKATSVFDKTKSAEASITVL